MRKLSCCIALLLVLCMSGAAFAQAPVEVPCGSLSEADCAILTSAQTSAVTLDSALYDFAFDLAMTNIPETPGALNFSLTGSGSFSGMSAVQALAAGMDMTDIAAMQEHFGQYVGDVLGAFDGDLNLTLSLPQALVGSAVPESINLQARLVDGIGYLNLDTLAPVIGDPQDTLGMSGWVGLDLVGLMREAMAQMSGDMFSGSSMMPNAAMDDYMAAFSDPQFLSDFMAVTRTDDGSGDTAVFAFDIDFGRLMSSPEFQQMMRDQMHAQAETMGTTMSDEEIGEALAMSSQMFKGMTMTFTEEIGLEDGYLHAVTGSMVIDTSGMMASISEMEGASAANLPEAAPVITMNFSFNYSSFNSAPAVTAPEDATIIPLEELLGSSMSSASMSGASPMEMSPTPTPAS